MASFGNLRIGTRLTISFGIVVVLLAVLAGVAYLKLQTLNAAIALTTQDRYPKTVILHKAIDALNENSREVRNIVLATDADDIRMSLGNIDNNTSLITESLATLDKTISANEGREKLQAVLDALAKYVPAQAHFVQMVTDNHIEMAKTAMFTELSPAQNGLLQAFNRLVEFQGGLMLTSGEQADEQVKQSSMIVLALAIAAGVAAVLLGIVTTRSITGPMSYAVGIARRVADGDLSGEIIVRSKDETGQLVQALKGMNDSLAQIVTRVRAGTDAIATASAEIASGNLDLSGRTEQQAGSLEETASAMEQLTSTVKQNADNARQANQLAVSASEVAQQGGEIVGNVVATMGSINDSSKKIVDIISVIDSIAFQTNILALNAAVEAARAGEQGRGFAVVASEVRNLAQRSASAAKEIKGLISDSVDQVGAGSKLVEQAGETMREVVASVKRVTDIVGEISAASQEQSSGIHEINQAIVQMDQSTQQNAALVEQAAAAASSLQSQAATLAQTVGIFRTVQSNADSLEADDLEETAAPPQVQAKIQPPVRTMVAAQSTEVARPRPPNNLRIDGKPASAASGRATFKTNEDEWSEF